jgi:hypothetical protein
MAREIAKIVAVPRRLPLGCQRQSLHFPGRRAKERRWPDVGVSNKLAPTSEAAATRLSIYGNNARFYVAILGQRAAAGHNKPIALGILMWPRTY